MITCEVTPVPLNPTICGLPVALSAMFNVAVRVPFACGVNTTLITQLAPAASVPVALHPAPDERQRHGKILSIRAANREPREIHRCVARIRHRHTQRRARRRQCLRSKRQAARRYRHCRRARRSRPRQSDCLRAASSIICKRDRSRSRSRRRRVGTLSGTRTAPPPLQRNARGIAPRSPRQSLPTSQCS